MSRLRRFALGAACAALGVAALGSGRATAGPDAKGVASRLAAQVGPAVVTLRGVVAVKATMGGQEVLSMEQEQSTRGVVVDPSGFVVFGLELHVLRALEAQLPGLSISVDFRRIEVAYGDEGRDRPAVLVARDATLGLAFLQVLDLGDKTLPALDLGKGGGTTSVGATLYGVTRLSRGFDHALSVLRTHVVGVVEQPRRAALVDGDLAEHGTFVFDGDGRLAGLFAVQLGAEGIETSSTDAMAESVQAVVLPLELVRAAVEQAKKKVPEALERARKDAEAGKEPAPDAPKEPAPDAPKEPAPAR